MLTRELRRMVCVHEAGHAIIHALGGSIIHGVAVAPEGSESWTYTGRKGGALVDLWGVCEPSDFSLASMHLSWDDDELRYLANRAGFNSMTRSIVQSLGAGRGKPFLADCKRQVRLQVCGLLAGPIAECLYDKGEFNIWDHDDWYDPEFDLAKADGLSRLLPYRGELEHASTLTQDVLRVPAIWARVIALAEELERRGHVDVRGVSGFLPQPVLTWPLSMASKGRAELMAALT